MWLVREKSKLIVQMLGQARAQRLRRAKPVTTHNARRHGLSLSILADPSFRQKLKASRARSQARELPARFLDSARRVAEAQIDVMRVRQARLDLLSRNLNNPHYTPDKYFRTAHATIKIVARHMRQFGPFTPLRQMLRSLLTMSFIATPKGRKNSQSLLLDLRLQAQCDGPL